MLKFFHNSLKVDIEAHQIHVSQQIAKFTWATRGESTRIFSFDIELDKDAFAYQWESVFANYPRRRCLLEITLSDVLFKFFMLEPPADARSVKDFQAAAQMKLETLFDVDSDDWLISADWRRSGQSLICAIPKVLLSKITNAAKKFDQKILTIQPRFVRVWNACKQTPPIDSWFASVDEHAMTLAALQDGSVYMIASILLPRDSDTVWVQTQLQRQAMLHLLISPTQLLLAGRIPATWQTNLLHQTDQYQIAKIDFTDKTIAATAASGSSVTAS